MTVARRSYDRFVESVPRFGGFEPYVRVADRQGLARRRAAALEKEKGRPLSPVRIEGRGRAIARSFWGKAWCDNLESYGDYANRLPRGRSYARNGSVIDLEIAAGVVRALVSGSEVYEIEVAIDAVAAAHWKRVSAACVGRIDSLVELLQGRLSDEVMEVVTRGGEGLFPTPREIRFDCSCPDAARMCKHVAATLYGVGARLDQEPGLLFTLRGVDPAELIGSAASPSEQTSSGGKTIDDADLSAIFGIDVATDAGPVRAAVPAAPRAKYAARV
jgi:uncharacterized Zn finger protein